jgi:hypothetical protein
LVTPPFFLDQVFLMIFEELLIFAITSCGDDGYWGVNGKEQ